MKIHIFLFQTSISTNYVAQSKRQVKTLNISTFTNATPVTLITGGNFSALYVPRYVTQAQGMMWFTMVTGNPTGDVIVEEEEMTHARH